MSTVSESGGSPEVGGVKLLHNDLVLQGFLLFTRCHN